MNIKIKVIFDVMSDMIAFRDDVTGGHLNRTCEYLRHCSQVDSGTSPE